MQLLQITDEQNANEALKGAEVGKKIRITFKPDVGEKFQQQTFLQLQHKLEFDKIWLAVAHNRLAVYGNWGDIPRAHDFTIKRMSPADREIFAHVLAEIAESVEIL